MTDCKSVRYNNLAFLETVLRIKLKTRLKIRKSKTVNSKPSVYEVKCLWKKVVYARDFQKFCSREIAMEPEYSTRAQVKI